MRHCIRQFRSKSNGRTEENQARDRSVVEKASCNGTDSSLLSSTEWVPNCIKPSTATTAAAGSDHRWHTEQFPPSAIARLENVQESAPAAHVHQGAYAGREGGVHQRAQLDAYRQPGQSGRTDTTVRGHESGQGKPVESGVESGTTSYL